MSMRWKKRVPTIGRLTLNEIHRETLYLYIGKRCREGIESGTITRELTVVGRIEANPPTVKEQGLSTSTGEMAI
jgi:hypothetical protein